MDKRIKKIIKWREEDEMTLEEIGIKLGGLSRERVRQLYAPYNKFPRHFRHKTNTAIKEIRCPGCSEIKIVNKDRKYCSLNCFYIALRRKSESQAERRCAVCNEVKEIGEFYQRKSAGRKIPDSYCKPCRNDVTKGWKKKNPEKALKIQKRADAKRKHKRNKI